MKKLSKKLIATLTFGFALLLCLGTTLTIVKVNEWTASYEESTETGAGNSGEIDTSNGESGASSDSGDVSSTDIDGYWTDYVSSSSFSGGSGTSDDPYLISCAEDLAYISYAVMSSSSQHFSSTYFEQTCAIDLSAHYWIPIGGHSSATATSTSYYFGGNYDGGGYTISGLTTYYGSASTSYSYMGLFGYVRGTSSSAYSNVHDIVISSDSTIKGYQYVGGVVGYVYSCTIIYNCINSGTVTGSSSNVGGIVGYVYGGSSTYFNEIYSCENSGEISGTSDVGGISGYAYYYVNIYECDNAGGVTGSSFYVGGIVGYVRGYSESYFNQIYSCENSGEISGASYLGGISGYAYYYTKIYECNNTGSVTGSSYYVGGIVGYIDGFLSCYNEIYSCENSAEISCSSSYVGGIVGYAYRTTIGISAGECQNLGYISGKSYVAGCIGYAYFSTYTYCSNSGTVSGSGSYVGDIVGYAIDYSQDYWISDSSYYSTSWSGSGTSSAPYLIQSAADLALLSYNVFNGSTYSGVYFEQTASIDLSAHYWMPIGGHCSGGISTSYYFRGIYNGGGFTIYGLTTYYNGSASSYMGLFGYTYGTSSSYCNIHDIVISSDSTIEGTQYIGSVVGYAYYYTNIYNCINSGTVTGSSSNVGGIVGYVYGGSSTYFNEIYSCENSGEISGTSDVGGISGYAYYYVNIYECDNAGGVTGSFYYVGGIVGIVYGRSSTYFNEIYTCDNSGVISGVSNVGGLVGHAYNHTEVYDCNNFGSVTGSSSYIGGIVGYSVGNSSSYINKIYSCNNSGAISGGSEVGGIVGYACYYVNVYSCDNSYSVTGIACVGGIVGESYAYSSSYYNQIYACNNSSEIYGNQYIGGIVGVARYTTIGLSTGECKNTGDICGDDYIGGCVGAVSSSDYAYCSNSGTVTGNGDFVGNIVGYDFDSGEDYWISDSSYYSSSWSGLGTSNEPYLIQSAADLALLSYNVYNGSTYSGVYFEQTANIDLSAHYWMPIGGHCSDGTSYDYYFAGNYNGGGYTISGIKTISLPSSNYNYMGLFGYVTCETSYANIENVSIENSTITGYQYVGAVVGYIGGTVNVTNCDNSSAVVGSSYVSGIVGYIVDYVNIHYCQNSGEITATSSSVGGIVGFVYDGADIRNCYNTGSVTGGSYGAGGILGYSDYGGDVYNCYNIGSVAGPYSVGGIVGGDANKVYDCFNLGDVTATSTSSTAVGGIVGSLGRMYCQVYFCYYNCTITGKDTDSSDVTYQKGIGYDNSTSAEGVDEEGITEYVSNLSTLAKTESWFTNSDNWFTVWDFEYVWTIETEGSTYPTFNIQEVDYWTSDASYYSTAWLTESEGIETDPYIIDSAEDLAGLAYLVNSGEYTFLNCYFEQTCNIDLSAHYWMPIGGASSMNFFAGNYDGGGHLISGIFTYDYKDYVGLFGVVAAMDIETGEQLGTASVHDLGIENSIIIGANLVGSIAGYIIYTEIYNCYNTGSVTGFGYDAGGIVGNLYASSLSNCYNTGSVIGTDDAGGIAGSAYSCENLSNCYNTGKIIGGGCVGGIVGYLAESSVYNLFSGGDVHTTEKSSSYRNYVGGVIGFTYSSTVSNCYYGDCTITDGDGTTYQKGIGYDRTTSAEGVDASGVVECLSGISSYAKTESWFTDSDNWDSTYAWDFSDIWRINQALNDGYPVFSWQSAYIYDEDGNFWYFEDGYMPQSYCASTPTDVGTSSASAAYSILLSSTSYAQVEIYSGTDCDYALVTLSSGASAWFVVEPIVWIVAYGSETPTSVTSAVTAQIVTAGYVYSNASATFSWANASVLRMSAETLEAYMGLSFASVGDFAYDSFSGSLSQLAVNDDATTLSSKIAVSSVDEIDALGGTYASTCTDFVAFLLSGGSSTDGDSYSADYWTRDLSATLDSNSTYCTEFNLDSYTSVVQLNNGVYVTKDGTLNNAKLSTLMGARLTMNV